LVALVAQWWPELSANGPLPVRVAKYTSNAV